MGAEFHAGERTDTMKLIFALRNFVNAPKNDKVGATRSYRVNISNTAVFLETPGSFEMGSSL